MRFFISNHENGIALWCGNSPPQCTDGMWMSPGECELLKVFSIGDLGVYVPPNRRMAEVDFNFTIRKAVTPRDYLREVLKDMDETTQYAELVKLIVDNGPPEAIKLVAISKGWAE